MSQLVGLSHQIGWQDNLPATPQAGSAAFGTAVTASSTIHTKGDWIELIASTTNAAYGFWLIVSNTSGVATRTDALLDIGIGAAASEVVIVPNLLVGWTNTAQGGPKVLWIPIYIPKGIRIAARAQALISSDTVDVAIFLNQGWSGTPPDLFSGCDAYGIATSTSQGTSHTPGASGSYSSYASIGSTTSRAYGGVLLLVGGVFSGTALLGRGHYFDLGVGSVTLARWYVADNTAEIMRGPFPPGPVNVPIVSGAQLQTRATCNTTSPQDLDMAFYCFF